MMHMIYRRHRMGHPLSIVPVKLVSGEPPEEPDIGELLIEDAVAYYRLESSDYGTDLTGTWNLTGTGGGSVTGDPATFTRHYALARTTNSTDMTLQNGWSVVAHFRRSIGNTTQSIIGKWNSSSNRSWMMYFTGTNLLTFAVSSAGTDTVQIFTTATTADTDYHLVFNFTSSGTCTWWLNGSADSASNSTAAHSNSSSRFAVGAAFSAATTVATGLTGTIYSAGVFNRHITADEAAYLYNGGSPIKL
jgi:hypothetical protein